MLGENIERLALAIRSQEGWRSARFSDQDPEGGTRSYRNHNPGNLRKSPFQTGCDGEFAIFHSDFAGFFALQWDIWSKANGNTSTGLNGDSTLRDLIYRWAPPNENDSEKYLERVVMLSGFSDDMKLSELLKK